jgi:hypothetical protein
VNRALLIALSLVSTLGWPGDAAAVSQVAPGGVRIVGPQVDGDHVIWGAYVDDGLDFRVLGPDGQVSDAGSAAGGGQWGIAADAGEFAYWRQEIFWSIKRCYDYYNLRGAEIAVGPYGGPFDVLDRCPGSTRIPETCETDHCTSAGSFVELSDRVLAFAEFCEPFKTVVRDLDTGETRVHDLLNSGPAQVVGRYLAVHEGSYDEPGDIVVSDSLTGEERFRVQQSTASFALAPDGLLALYDPETGELSWASQQDPSIHHVANAGLGYQGMQVRRGLIALGRWDPIHYEIDRFSVFDLAGRSVSTPATDAPGTWDFDGRRVAWSSAPCEFALVVAWDVRSEPPAIADGNCPVARPVSATKRIRRDHILRMELECPEQPPLGCLNVARVVAKTRDHGRRLLGKTSFAVLPGETREARLELDRRTYKWLRRSARAKAVSTLFAVRRDGQEAQERRRFKFVIKAR